MKNLLVLVIVTIIMFTACSNENETENLNLAEGPHIAVVKEKLETTSYSYLKVKEADNIFWIASPKFKVEEGDTLAFSKWMEMKNFKGEELGKEFKLILFVEDLKPLKEMRKTSSVHGQAPSSHMGGTAEKRDDIKVSPIKGGLTIEKIYADKNSLNGKTVKVIGVVTKFTANILDYNWIHLQDGSGNNNDFDLIITTKDKTDIGETIVAEGKVVLDKDFNGMLKYDLLLENAKIKTTERN